MAIKRGNWKDIKGFQARPGAIRRVFSGEKSMMVLNEIQPFAKTDIHSHPHEQIVYIVEGNCDFYYDKEVFPMGPGDLVVVPPNVPHTVKVKGDKPVLNLDVFTPIREDYLNRT